MKFDFIRIFADIYAKTRYHMKKLSEFIKEVKPSELAKLRGKRAKDSSRDKQTLLRRITELESAFLSKGRIVLYTDFEYLKLLSDHKEINIDAYSVRINKKSLTVFKGSKPFEVQPLPQLINKLIDKLKNNRINMLTFEIMPNDDIIELIETAINKG